MSFSYISFDYISVFFL